MECPREALGVHVDGRVFRPAGNVLHHSDNYADIHGYADAKRVTIQNIVVLRSNLSGLYLLLTPLL